MKYKRIIAYLIDCFILFVVLTILGLVIPTFGNINEINNELEEVLNNATNITNDEDVANEQIEKLNNLSYDLAKATYLTTVVGIVVYILYFVVYQARNNGQTLGKKLMKIRVVKNDGTVPDINTLIKRCLIPYGILINIILLILLLIISKASYISISSIIQEIHIGVLLVTIIMIVVKGRGIHDYIAGTKVENV